MFKLISNLYLQNIKPVDTIQTFSRTAQIHPELQMRGMTVNHIVAGRGRGVQIAGAMVAVAVAVVAVCMVCGGGCKAASNEEDASCSSVA